MANMSWKEQYADKLVSMETAAGKISSGDVLVFSIGIGLPYLFLDKLAKRKDKLEHTEIGMLCEDCMAELER